MGKRARLWKMVQDIRASYWFLPSVLVIFGLFLASLTEWIDRNAGLLPFGLPTALIDSQADGARSTLAVIAQSIIGVTGVMFSMTLVAVSFASGNFGPRLIGNFMRDRGNQWSLGILISTFVYSVVVLRTVQNGLAGGADQFVPQYSLIVALCLTLLCVFTLIYFIHHVPETINVSKISASLGARLEKQLCDGIDCQNLHRRNEEWPIRSPNTKISATASGYIQTCNMDRLNDLAIKNNWYVDMLCRVGDFVTTSNDIFAIWTDENLTDADEKKLRSCFAVGTQRTENQNPTFLAEQLVEMIARALSPGVNDPYTAIDCLNRLASVLTVASTYKGGLEPPVKDRLRTVDLTFERLFDATLPRCRQYIKPDRLALDHALEVLENLKQVVRHQDIKVIEDEIAALRES